MPVTPEENKRYRQFVADVAADQGCFRFDPEEIVWHYTDGAGFLGIIQSSTLYATQVSALNDMNETKYATDLFKDAVQKVRQENRGDVIAETFLQNVLEAVKEDPHLPTHGTSKFFVTSFSGEEDDLTQWDRYGKENGYAIGFYARGFYWREPTSTIYRVFYDRTKQEEAVKKVADATLQFFLEGLNEVRTTDAEKWGREFFAAWNEWVYKLAPLAKDAKWKAENESRIVHELRVADLPRVRFVQKRTMLARYLALDTPNWVKRRSPLLPIAKVIIGPGNHPTFTKVSVQLLLEQMGYLDVPVESTKTSFRRT
jgi:Protein of unknown function (DUF2971)